MFSLQKHFENYAYNIRLLKHIQNIHAFTSMNTLLKILFITLNIYVVYIPKDYGSIVLLTAAPIKCYSFFRYATETQLFCEFFLSHSRTH